MADNGVWRTSLDTSRLGAAPWPVEVLAETGSTNAVLADRARAGGAEQVLVTEHQTAGRGRLDRTWDTPARAALTFSVLLRPAVEPSRWPLLPLLVGSAVRTAVARLGVPATVKWPNDVLIGELKVAGILVERVDSPAGAAAVVGVGLNVSTTADELPVPTATSLTLELARDQGPGHEPDRTALLLDLLTTLERGYGDWVEKGDGFLRTAYVPHCSTLGREVRVDLPGARTLRGTARDLDGLGRLVVDTADGSTSVDAGDVVHVRRDDQ
ncbi:biotin--[acetyl-CoA-carboxylase] ligase [Nocardioides sp.]|uniref:biotin--[acetyl-CoA-carboxylase] ligase n=1 Tax=Nocardioides sp. TaxID=35761 RepID=UPI003D10B6F0